MVAHEEDHVTAIELAEWIRDRKPGLRVIDIRPEAEFAAFHVPTATNVPIESLASERFAPADTVVLYSDASGHAAQAWVFLRALGHERVYFLRGGVADWVDDVLNPKRLSSASLDEIARFERIAALSRYFGGVPQVVEPSSLQPGRGASDADRNDPDPTDHTRGGRVVPPVRERTPPSLTEIARLRRRGC